MGGEAKRRGSFAQRRAEAQARPPSVMRLGVCSHHLMPCLLCGAPPSRVVALHLDECSMSTELLWSCEAHVDELAKTAGQALIENAAEDGIEIVAGPKGTP
jgi:hypothetical protein